MVNIDAMTHEELKAFVRAGGLLHAAEPEGAQDQPEAIDVERVRVVTVGDAFEIEIDPAALSSWRFVSIAARTQNPDARPGEKMAAAVEFVEFVFGDKLPAALDYLGGADVASVSDVLKLASDVIEAAGLKN